jgi:hypothetical protein
MNEGNVTRSISFKTAVLANIGGSYSLIDDGKGDDEELWPSE